VNVMRGWHICEFCHQIVEVLGPGGQSIILGDAEIRIKGNAAKVYAAPNLVYHYVQAHRYRPPDEFLEALIGIE